MALQYAGLSRESALLVNDSISIAGCMGGPTLVAKASQSVVSSSLTTTSTAINKAKLNRFNKAAYGLSSEAKNNVRILRGWAKSKGWTCYSNKGGPEKWGSIQNGNFQWNLLIKPEGSFRQGLEAGSRIPRFDARLEPGRYINPFSGQTGKKEIGTHIPLDMIY